MTDPNATTPTVAIVGSGFGGLAAACALQDRGIHTFTILERADELGGVWRDNTYPGAACDVPSHLYSFSFLGEHRWTRRFAPQTEIRAYLHRVARERGLLEHVRTCTEVSHARWDEEGATWRLTLADGEELTADVLVPATGQLSRPSVPALPGHDDFAGTQFHSARWEHDAPIDGTRVAVVGTGASAIQFAPEIADRAGQLTVFQSSAPHVIHKADPIYTARQQRLFAASGAARRAHRAWLYLRSEARFPAFVGQPVASRIATWVSRRHRRRQLADPRLRAKVTPDDPIGCKRILQSDDWYPALARDNVEVVDQRVSRIESDAVVAADGTRVPADVLVYGTGFKSTEFVLPMRVTGRDERGLQDVWADGARAHLGIEVPGFPNLLLMYGPNTNLGHNSIIFMLERQAGYLAEAVAALRDQRLASTEIRTDVAERFDADLQERLAGTVWASGCSSWYVTENGRITNNWPGTTIEYAWRTRRYELADHDTVARAPTRSPTAA